MIHPYIKLRRLGPNALEWVRAPGCRISDGIPRVRDVEYSRVVWSSIPMSSYAVVARILLRTERFTWPRLLQPIEWLWHRIVWVITRHGRR